MILSSIDRTGQTPANTKPPILYMTFFCRSFEEQKTVESQLREKFLSGGGLLDPVQVVPESTLAEKQKLVDICFSIALTLSTPGRGRDDKWYDLTKLSTTEKAVWIAEQLRAGGFDTTQCGASWGVLK